MATLRDAAHYWIATTNADGRPHTRPVWGVVVDGTVFFSTGSKAVENLARGSAISVHTESATRLVILEGTAEQEHDRATVEQICADYAAKYDERLDPDDLPGPFWAVHPSVAFGWLAEPNFRDGGATFHGTATRWTPRG
ncbi:hypothetical protein BCD49_24520 [Pseudofrankia sp. EUN1h]|nr:hypothetical protein BCD49_24520 [Pseudofrankia sp. EUN1h]